MMWWNRFLQAGSAAYAAARRVFEDPGSAYQPAYHHEQISTYNLLWSYYSGELFDKACRTINSQLYKQNYNLYRNIRLIYNPVRRLVEFYAGHVYPGVLSEDGSDLPDGVELAIPFSKDTDPALRAAIAQFWAWSNWQAQKSVEVRYGAALGNVLVEVVDDLERRKVYAEICWPGHVCDLQLDRAGNMKGYTLEHPATDEEGYYTYKKVVDQYSFTYYRNGELYDYGNGAVIENPYGFVPAIWIKHVDTGTDFGSPAMAGSQPKVDELNNLASHTNDQIHKIIGAPLVLWAGSGLQNLFNTEKRGPTSEFVEPTSEQENVLMLKGPQGGHVESLAGNLNLADVAIHMDRLISEIEHDHPELTFYEQLRSMSQVTGPAAARLTGDVGKRVLDIQAVYDQANISLFRMAVAIGGFRANTGAWGQLSPQQQKFVPFDLTSFEQGDLDLAMKPRPLVVPTRTEIALEKQAFWTGVGTAVQQAGIPVEIVLRDEGWTDEQITALQDATDREAKAQQASIQRQQFLSQADTIPTVQQ